MAEKFLFFSTKPFWKQLFLRFCSGLLLFALVVCLVAAFPFWGSAFLAFLVVFLGLLEYRLVLEQTGQAFLHKKAFVVAGLGMWLFASSYGQAGWFFGLFFGPAFYIFWEVFQTEKLELPLMQKLNWGVLGLLWVPGCISAALSLVQLPLGLYYLLYGLLVVCFVDVFAYFGGSFFGRKPLFPLLSPNKTIAGLWFGLFGGVFGGWLAFVFSQGKLPSEMIFASVFLSLVAIFGDIFQSLFKRCLGVKDTGTILPGHGGILDRLDSSLPSAVLLYWLYFLTN